MGCGSRPPGAGIYADGELQGGATIRNFRIVQSETGRKVTRDIAHYNLEAILAIGYRVRSPRGTQFRQWATARLNELLVKGFTMDDERLKAGKTIGQDYFDELLARIRDIRASGRLLYQKVTDIYATSIDYDPASDACQKFFATVQNKLHWAIHGRTAAELVHERADAARPHMGLTTWKNAPAGPVRRPDVAVAKNYLTEPELTELNRVVGMYLDYAEDQAKRHHPMPMADWAAKLDAFLSFNERNILSHAGAVSHGLAEKHAVEQFERYEAKRLAAEPERESDFDRLVKRSKRSL
ncbi:MAG: virulence RhuM family protein [Planctomycetota bacterium]